MRKQKGIMKVLRGLIDVVGDEAANNPAFAGRLEGLLSALPGESATEKKGGVPKASVEVPDVYAEWESRGATEFRLWLRDQPIDVLRAIIRQHDLDATGRTGKWKDAEKISAYVTDQLQARRARGSSFLGQRRDPLNQPVIDAPCFLCGAAARYQETDAGNRRHYFCPGPPSGEYEISNRARKELDQSPELKARVSADAHRDRERGKFLEVIVSPTTQQLTFTAVG